MRIEYRKFNENDFEELKLMIKLLYKEDSDGQEINERKINRTINEFIKNPCKIAIIMIICEDIVVGYSIIIPFWSNEYGGNILHIDELFIKENYRDKGIGTDFMKKIHKMFDDTVALQLEVTPINVRAKRYYEKLGFIQSMNSHLINTF